MATRQRGGVARDSMMSAHRFCWADLACVDDARAAAFYAALFGWTPIARTCARGRFTVLADRGQTFASLYRLDRARIASGMPSHWLPYVSTGDIDATLQRATALGGQAIVTAHAVPGIARIAVLVDPTGAALGLWQSDGAGTAPPGAHAGPYAAGEDR